MSITLRFTLMAILAFIPCAAFADQSWVCSVSDFGQAPKITRYTMKDGFLVDDTKDGLTYKVLQNNEYGLIATYSISGMKQGSSTPSINAITVMINKKDMHFNVMHSPIWSSDNLMTEGQSKNGDCIKN